jgi:hypothetical protein
MNQMRFLSDQAIDDPALDELGTAAFVRRPVDPVRALPARHSAVVGIYGKWGQGKTTALNLLRRELNQAKSGRKPIVVEFNPWSFGSVDALVVAFFGTLRAELRRSGQLDAVAAKELDAALGALALLSVPVLALADVPSAVAKLAGGLAAVAKELLKSGEETLREHKRTISKHLRSIAEREPSERVVVIIDDVDRLPDEEVVAVVRLLRLLADLPNITYVVGMDDRRVADALRRGRSSDFGRAYLEKIVQVPIALPPIEVATIERLVVPEIRRILQKAGVSTEGLFAPESWGSGIHFRETLGMRMRTLRDRARYLNSLMFMMGSGAAPDVTAQDVVMLTFLQVFYPQVYSRLPANAPLLTGQLTARETFARIGSRDQGAAVTASRESQMQELCRADDSDPEVLAPDVHAKLVRAVMDRLFPGAVLAPDRGYSAASEQRRGNRIASPDRFDGYFLLRPAAGQVSDADARAMMRLLAEDRPDDAASLRAISLALDPLRQKSSGQASRATTIAICDRAPDLTHAEQLRVVRRVALLTEEFDAESYLLFLRTLVDVPSELADKSLDEGNRHRRSVELSVTACSAIADDFDSVVVCGELLRLLRMRRADPILMKECAVIGADRGARAVHGGRDLLGVEFNFAENDRAWRWRDALETAYGSAQPMKEHLIELASRDRRFVPPIIALAAGWSESPSLRHRPRSEVMLSLDPVFGGEALVASARQYLRDFGGVEASPRLEMARAFIALVTGAPVPDDSESAE